jgi:protein dithiol:quinone oxidoreductase
MTKRSFRLCQNSISFLTVFAIFFAFYLQYGLGLQPCPLCLMQRGCAFVFLFLCLLALFLKSIARAKHVVLFQIIFSALGLFFASRQLWLESMTTPETAACLPGIEMLMRYFPWRELVHLFLWGSNSCGEVAWRAYGLSMAAWSAMYFGVMFLISGVLFCRLLLTPIRP